MDDVKISNDTMRHWQLIPCLLLGLLTCLSSARSVAAADLVAHYRLNETQGTTATDSSALGNDGTYTNSPLLGQAGPYPGELTTAPQFNGTSNYVEIPDNSAYSSQVSSGITVAAWVKALALNTDSHSQTRQPIVAKGNSGDWEWALYVYDYGGAGFSVWQKGGSSHNELSGGNVPLGTWVHVAATFEPGVANRVYINGVEVAQKTTFTGKANDGTSNVRIASRLDGQFFNAEISDVRIYGRPLTASEIAELYGLVGHWKMDEGTGTIAADATVFANDATLSGATWTTDCTGKNALAFDGVSNRAATNAAFSPPAIGAVAFWMQASGTPTVRERIFGVNGNWEARQETTGKISFDLGASPYVGNEPFASDEVDDQDRWYHIVAAFNESDDSYEVYVNGELQASGISPVNLVPQKAGILSFGTRTGSSENWKGSLRDFRVYNRWLSADEISRLSGIIAHWNMEETSGTVAADSSVAGNDASYVGAPVLGVSGPFLAKTGLAVELDGTSTSVATGKSLLNDLTEFSLAAWIRPDSVTPNISILGQNGLIELGISSQTNQIEFWTNSGGSVTASGYLSLDKWSHLVAIGDGLSLKLYVNGAEVATGGSSTSSYGSNSAFFKIGEGVLAPSGDYFAGRVDDVRVYSRVMCLEEVRALYRGGRPNGVRILKWVEVR